VRQAPKFAEQGEPGEELWVTLELKLLADVALVGYPNVGKSTLISRMSAARPKIADYHFTTLVPNLGVVSVGPGQSFVVADIPGLIEGASEGAGLGHEFLRHIERTRAIVHVLDAGAVEGRDPLDDFAKVNAELAAFRPELAERPQLVAANKLDLTGAEETYARIRPELERQGYRVFGVSGATGRGISDLIAAAAALVLPSRAEEAAAQRPIEGGRIEYVGRTERQRELVGPLDIAPEGEGVWRVTGEGLDRLVRKLDMTNEDAVKHLQAILRRRGLDETLAAAGVKDGDTVHIADQAFDFVPEEDE
jgi:GTP-binding protein